MIMPHTELWKAVVTEERIRVSLAERQVGKVEKPVTVSIGVAELEQEESRDSVMHRADQALDHAKRPGRDKVVTADPSKVTKSSGLHLVTKDPQQ